MASLVLYLVVLAACLTYWYFKKSFRYWSDRGVFGPKASIPFGTFSPFQTQRHGADQLDDCYHYGKKLGEKVVGIYSATKPSLVVVDLQLMKEICCQDFAHFHDRGLPHDEEFDPLSAHLFTLEGAKWKNLRAKLTPTFTSGKLKHMYGMVAAIAERLADHLGEYSAKGEPCEVRRTMTCYTADIIGSCSFGIDCNCINDPTTEFMRMSEKFFSFSTVQAIKSIFQFAFPKLTKALNFKLIDPEVSEFFLKLVADIMGHRRSNPEDRKDFMQSMIELVDGTTEAEKLTMEQATAQSLLFFLAGLETTASALSFAMLELAQDQEMQKRLRDEVLDSIAKNGEINYETIKDMKYMAMVVSETLRKYPVGVNAVRVCTKNYNIPGTQVTVEKGTNILIPIYSLHRDAEFYPNPMKFDPERFNETNKSARKDFTYIPFGDGPRNCIGVRFALMQIKITLAHLVKRFQITVHPKTCLPVEWEALKQSLHVKGGIWIDFNKI